MKFYVDKIFIKELIKRYEENNIDLNPFYQRNEIWSINSKKFLIDSINKNYPLPNFFIRIKRKDIWEVVDGQQRSRAIIGFYNNQFPTSGKIFYDDLIFPNYLNYEIPVVFITEIENEDTIKDFYVRVNSTGMKLNRPELKKAEYYDTKFLNLVQELTVSKYFDDLSIFTETSMIRMNDVDFVSELIALLKFGITEKKDAVDNLFETDITAKEYEEFKNEFLIISEIIFKFDTIYPIKKTRYKQRNDFYTLFGFVSQNKKIKFELLSYFYKILVLIGDDISPSNDECEPFKEYALNCVSQSNSKKARELRLVFLKELFLNESEEGNETQKKILDFYDLKISDMKKLNGFFTLDFDKLQSAVEYPQLTIL